MKTKPKNKHHKERMAKERESTRSKREKTKENQTLNIYKIQMESLYFAQNQGDLWVPKNGDMLDKPVISAK